MLGFSFSQASFPYSSKEPMKLKLPLIAAFVAVLSLSACGGGGSSNSSGSAVAADVAQLSYTDTTVGTGAKAQLTAGKTVTVNVTYTGWLYSATAGDHKGSQFDTGTFSFPLGQNQVVPGFEQGVTGMLEGGTRVVLIPSSLGYGASGSGPIPPNAGLVFQVTLNKVTIQ
jgi:FKBP-type peptidyl-prolyl cis-trans isomerase FkpA